MSQQPQTPEAAVARFLRGIEVRQVDNDLFEAAPDPDEDEGRIFGGQTLAQSVLAACRTVPDATIHSMHGYFLRPGKPEAPITYAVERVRESRSFAGRRVAATQGDALIYEAMFSFTRPEDGIEHQQAMPGAPRPEALADVEALRREHVERWGDAPAFDVVERRDAEAQARLKQAPHHEVWWRPAAPLPEDEAVYAAALAWMSDNMLYATVYEHHGLPTGVTLDHAIWWHRRPRFDGWLYRVSDSPAGFAARALMRSSIFREDGVLIASVAQEGLFRNA